MQPSTGVPAPSTSDKSTVADSFDAVAARYDLLQRLNPGYRKHLRVSARRLAAPAEGRILDLCCGTGLSTEALVQAYPRATITALDGSNGMLDLARRKPELSQVAFVKGDASAPREAGVSGVFDAIFMAYGIRNMVDPDACLHQLLALLRPAGRVAFHEYSVQGSRYSRAVWNAVASTLIVPLGRAVTGTDGLFRYLRASVNEFDSVASFQQRLLDAGYVDVSVATMGGWQRGLVHTFCARRPT